MRTIKEIILHCSATPAGRRVTTEQIRQWHTDPTYKGGNGWNDIGYHYVIELDGSIHQGRKEEVIGAHCQGHNQHSIGICYVGGMSADGKRAEDTRNVAQFDAMTRLLLQLKRKYPQATIHGHNEYANKACPSFDVKKYLKTVGLSVITLLMVLLIPSCATPKRSLNAETTRTEHTADSLSQAIRERLNQTTNLTTNTQTTHTDSTALKHANVIVEFTFLPEGGTVNPETGNMTGIASAKMQANIQQLQRTISSQQSQLQTLTQDFAAARDSLATYKANAHTELHEDIQSEQDAPSRPFGWRFCIVCTAIFWLIIAFYIAKIIYRIWLIK